MSLDINGDGAVVRNAISVGGNPAVSIRGADVSFTNAAGGDIFVTTYNGVALQIDGPGAIVVNEVGGVIRIADPYLTQTRSIQGSAFADTILNEGVINGDIYLGGGNDVFTQRSSDQVIIKFEGGDDVFRIEAASTYQQYGNGGDGFDRLIITGSISLARVSVTGFEQLEVGRGVANLDGFSGFSSVLLEAGGTYNFLNSANPLADIDLAGSDLTVGRGAVFKNITGGSGSDRLELSDALYNAGGKILGDVDLGAGSDSFTYGRYSASQPAPVLQGLVKGGAGDDTLNIVIANGATLDLSIFEGFEQLLTGSNSSVATNLRLIHADNFNSIASDHDGTLTLEQSLSPDAVLDLADRTTVTLEAGVIIGSATAGSLVSPGIPDPNSSIALTNAGTIRGDVSLSTGNDVLHGTNGVIGGHVLGQAGDDILLLGSGNDWVDGGIGNDWIETGLGDDRLDGGVGADTLTGGDGNDTYCVDNAGDIVVETAGGGVDTIQSSISLSLVSLADIENVTLTGAAAINATGNALKNVLMGNAAANILEGLGGDDVYVIDYAGDTVIEAAGGGTDTIQSSINVSLAPWAEVENVTLIGTAAINATGNALGNALIGNSGANILDGAGGADTMTGLGGNDTYVIDHVGDRVIEVAGGGIDTVQSASSLSLSSFVEIENVTLIGAAATNAIGDAFANVLTGNSAGNMLDGAAGADTMAGRSGDDIYYVDDRGDVVVEAAGDGTDIVYASVSYALNASSGVERISTAAWAATTAINLTGNALNNMMYGNAGANVLDGSGGIDVMVGFGGDDVYYVDNIGDYAAESAGGGTDIVYAGLSYKLDAGSSIERLSTMAWAATTTIDLTGNELNNILYGNAGSNVLDGSGGIDVMVGFGGDDIYYVDNIGDYAAEFEGGGTDIVYASLSYKLDAGSAVERLSTMAWAATTTIDLTGNELNNILYGNAGSNVLDGSGGIDVMVGFGGDDIYYVDNIGDYAAEFEGGGTDIVYASLSYKLDAGSAVERLSTMAWAATTTIDLTGNELNNILYGNAGSNVLDGGAGIDVMVGFGGDDTYHVDDPDDYVAEFAGGGVDTIYASWNYTLAPGSSIERLQAVASEHGFAALTGNELDNIIYGSDQTNVLDGGLGADILAGMGGSDAFIFSTALGAANVDRIVGYEVLNDLIELDDAVFAGLQVGQLADQAFRTGAAAQDADDRIIYNAATGALLFDADGVGGAAAVQFATLDPNLALSTADFLII